MKTVRSTLATIGIFVALIGIVGIIVGLGIYFFKNEDVKVNVAPLTIEKATFYPQTSSGFFTSVTHYYQQEQFMPNATAKPNQKYLVVIDFSLFKIENTTSWNELEINIGKAKTFTTKLSQDEYTALTNNSVYSSMIYEIKPEHNLLVFIPGILLLVIGIIGLIIGWRDLNEPIEIQGSNVDNPEESVQAENFYTKPLDIANIPWDPMKYGSPTNNIDSTQEDLYAETSNGKDRIAIPNNIKDAIIQRSRNACENPDCQIKYPIHIHHIDMNRTNNSKKNLIALCPKCHKDAHNGILINSQLRNWVRADYNRLRHERDN